MKYFRWRMLATEDYLIGSKAQMAEVELLVDLCAFREQENVRNTNNSAAHHEKHTNTMR